LQDSDGIQACQGLGVLGKASWKEEGLVVGNRWVVFVNDQNVVYLGGALVYVVVGFTGISGFIVVSWRFCGTWSWWKTKVGESQEIGKISSTMDGCFL
jgi:hypothetical protein